MEKNYWWLLTILFLVGFFPISNIEASQLEQVALDDDTYLVIDFRIRKDVTPLEGVDVFSHEGKYLLPVFSLLNALEYKTQISTSDKMVIVYIEDEKFELDFSSDNLSFLSIPNSIFAANEFEFYLDIESVSELLNVEVETLTNELVFNLLPNDLNYRFPIERRMIRLLEQRKRLIKGRQDTPSQQFSKVHIEDQYRLFSPPRFDFGLNLENSSDDGSLVTTSISGSSDLFYHASQYALNFNQSQELRSTVRFSKYKTDPTDILLGNVNSYSFGDVFTPGDGIATEGVKGIGFNFSKRPKNYSRQFGSTTIEGIAPPGWEVEIFRQGFFLGSVTVGDDGRYIFEGLETEYGINQFKLNLFGPFGEEEVRYETVQVGQNWLKPGEVSYQGGVVDGRSNLLNIDNDLEATNLSFGVDYGVDDRTQVSIDYYGRNVADINEQYLTTSGQFSYVNSTVRASLSAQAGQGFALETNILGTLGERGTYGINFLHLNDFDGVYGFQDEEMTIITGQWNSFFDFLGPKGFRFLGSFQDEFRQTATIGGRLSWNLFGISMFNRIRHVETLAKEVEGFTYDKNSRTTGTFGFSGNIWGGRSNTSVTYNIQDNNAIDNINVNYSKQFENKIAINNQVSYRLGNGSTIEDSWQYSTGLSWPTDKFFLLTNASYDSKESWRVSLGIKFSLGFNHQSNSMTVSRDSYKNSALLDLNAYLDRNSNQVLDSGDLALEGVSFGPMKNWIGLKTSANGRVLLDRLPTRNVINLNGRWEDGVIPSQGVHSVYTHPGGYVTADIPFTVTTEVAGYVMFDSADEIRPAAGIPILLINSRTQRIFRRTETDEDGFYEFFDLKPNLYEIHIDDEAMKDRGTFPVPTQKTILTPERGGYIDIGITVLKQGRTDVVQNEKVLLTENNYEPLIGEDEYSGSVYVKHLPVLADKFESLSNTKTPRKNNIRDNGESSTGSSYKTYNVNVDPNAVISFSSDGLENAKQDEVTFNEVVETKILYGIQIAAYKTEAVARNFINGLESSNNQFSIVLDEQTNLYKVLLGQAKESRSDLSALLTTVQKTYERAFLTRLKVSN